MTDTLANQILDELTERLRARLPEGWAIARRYPGEDTNSDQALAAWVFDDGESVVRNDTMTTTKDLQVQVLVQVQQADAEGVDVGNIDAVMRNQIGHVQAAALQLPDLATCEQLLLDSWQPFATADETRLRVLMRFRARYRHNVADPFRFAPSNIG